MQINHYYSSAVIIESHAGMTKHEEWNLKSGPDNMLHCVRNNMEFSG